MGSSSAEVGTPHCSCGIATVALHPITLCPTLCPTPLLPLTPLCPTLPPCSLCFVFLCRLSHSALLKDDTHVNLSIYSVWFLTLTLSCREHSTNFSVCSYEYAATNSRIGSPYLIEQPSASSLHAQGSCTCVLIHFLIHPCIRRAEDRCI